MKNKVLLTISIDTECDKGANWEIQYPLSFLSVIKGIGEKLHPFFELHEIIPTYLLSPEVIKDENSVKLLKNLKNCELGTHLHSEFIKPHEVSDPKRTQTPQCAYSKEIEKRKLENLTQLFYENFGYKPTSFRAGRFGISQNTLQILNDLDYLVDTSVTPFRIHKFDNGYETNFWGAPFAPYHPSKRNFNRKGNLNILETPVSSFIPCLLNIPPWFLRLTRSHQYWYKRLSMCKNDAENIQIIRPLRIPLNEVGDYTDKFVKAFPKNVPPIINVMFHNVEVIEGASPYSLTSENIQLIFNFLSVLINHLKTNYILQPKKLSELHTIYG